MQVCKLCKLQDRLPFRPNETSAATLAIAGFKHALAAVQRATLLLARFVAGCAAAYGRSPDEENEDATPEMILGQGFDSATLDKLVSSERCPAGIAHTLLRYRCTDPPRAAAYSLGLTEKVGPELAQPLGSREGMYAVFWSLDLSDLCYGGEGYKTLIEEAKRKEEAATAALSSSSKAKAERAKKVVAQAQSAIERLEGLKEAQKERVDGARSELEKLIPAWFKKQEEQPSKTKMFAEHTAFFQTCFWPRVLLSTEDAVYCARWLSSCGPFGFPSVRFTNYLAEAVFRLLPTCTDAEVARVGTFLSEHFRTWERCLTEKTALDAGGHPLNPLHYCIIFQLPLAKGALATLAGGAPRDDVAVGVELLSTISSHFPAYVELCERFEEALKKSPDSSSKDSPLAAYASALRHRRLDIESKRDPVLAAAELDTLGAHHAAYKLLLAVLGQGSDTHDKAVKRQRKLEDAAEKRKRAEEDAAAEKEAKKAKKESESEREKGHSPSVSKEKKDSGSKRGGRSPERKKGGDSERGARRRDER
eukprot:Hpha_TRINITY_DN15696_c1_g6::TRINITY_DN15696_c1_g6_i2::g.101480::m.101480